MSQLITVDRATLEQLVEFLEFHSKYWNGQGAHPMTVVTAGRAALANAETAGWQTLVDQGKEAHELAKIMKDFADKNPESLMLKELK